MSAGMCDGWLLSIIIELCKARAIRRIRRNANAAEPTASAPQRPSSYFQFSNQVCEHEKVQSGVQAPSIFIFLFIFSDMYTTVSA